MVVVGGVVVIPTTATIDLGQVLYRSLGILVLFSCAETMDLEIRIAN